MARYARSWMLVDVAIRESNREIVKQVSRTDGALLPMASARITVNIVNGKMIALFAGLIRKMRLHCSSDFAPIGVHSDSGCARLGVYRVFGLEGAIDELARMARNGDKRIIAVDCRELHVMKASGGGNKIPVHKRISERLENLKRSE